MKLLLLFFFFFISCSSGLKINPGRCPGLVKLKLKNEKTQGEKKFILREFGIGQKEVTLDQLLLEAKAPDCLKLESIRVSVESDFWDQMISIIPFFSQWTIEFGWNEPRKAK